MVLKAGQPLIVEVTERMNEVKFHDLGLKTLGVFHQYQIT